MMKTIEFKKTHTEAMIPARGSEGAAGFDLYYSCSDAKPVTLKPHERHLFKTGIECALPQGSVGQIWPRSGKAVSEGRDTLAGIIDEDYRGEIGVALINHGSEAIEILPGERIAQMVVTPFFRLAAEVSELSETVRGGDGYGSTGEA